MTTLTREEILERVRHFVKMNGSHELPDYEAIWRAAEEHARNYRPRGGFR